MHFTTLRSEGLTQRKLILGANSCCNSIFGNEKWKSYFLTKCDKSLLQNASAFFVENEAVTIKYVGTICEIV